MAEPAGATARPTDPIGRVLFAIAYVLAILGGVLTFAMALVVTVSVTGRYLLRWPIPGDYDIVAILCGCAIFAFLPYCQLTRGNVIVDFFTTGAPPRVKACLDAGGTAIYLIAATLLTWRLYYGMLELRQSSEVLAAFNFYRWWTLPFDLFCMGILVLTIAYTLVRDLADIGKGVHPEPAAEGTRSYE
jgi:TRAP-type C4-dicarboxylate transport system permease small subunit